ncbi:hypothetical protein BH10BAC4_BH10BAC4_18460 [soil metagenome]
MMKGAGFIFVILLLQMGLSSCDTRSNVEDPSLTHFVKFYGGDGDQAGNDLVALPDGTFILFGTSKASHPDSTSQWYLVKTDVTGNVIWEKKYGVINQNETASDIELTPDGRLVAVGNTYKNSSDGDVLIMTFSLDGNKLQETIVGLKKPSTTIDTDEDAVTVTPLTPDGFIVSGSTSSTKVPANPTDIDNRDAMTLRFYNDLQQFPSVWGQTYGRGTYDAAVKVIQKSDIQFYVFGYSNGTYKGNISSNFWIYGLGATGTPNTDELLMGTPTAEEKSSSVSVSPFATGYLMGGISYGPAGTSNIYLSKLRKDLTFEVEDIAGVRPDVQFEKSISINIGSNVPDHTSVIISKFEGYYVLANEKNVIDNQNWLLTKLGNDGLVAWNLPIVFGGEGTDAIGAIQELPDGRLLLIGTMKTGKPDTGESKMALLKVSKDGKLVD